MEARDIQTTKDFPISIKNGYLDVIVRRETSTVTIPLEDYEQLKRDIASKDEKINNLEEKLDSKNRQIVKCFETMNDQAKINNLYHEIFTLPLFNAVRYEGGPNVKLLERLKEIIEFRHQNNKRKSGIVEVWSWRIVGDPFEEEDADKE